jgi:hypothetical protein
VFSFELLTGGEESRVFLTLITRGPWRSLALARQIALISLIFEVEKGRPASLRYAEISAMLRGFSIEKLRGLGYCEPRINADYSENNAVETYEYNL